MPVKQPANVPTPVKRPSVGINPNIPVPVQRELRKVADYAFDAHSNANTALAALPEKPGVDPVYLDRSIVIALLPVSVNDR